MQSWDGFLHVNPFASAGGDIGVGMLFNPTDSKIDAFVNMNLYYTGATDSVVISINGADTKKVTLSRDYSFDLQLTMPPKSSHTVVITRS